MSRSLVPVLLALCVVATACGNSSGDQAESEPGVILGEANNDQVRANGDHSLTGLGPPRSLPLTAADDARPVIVGHVNGAAVVAYAEPSSSSSVIAQLTNPTPIGGPLAFQLVERNLPEGQWVEVYLPVRPNGSTGWVAADQLEYSANPYRIDIDRDAHELTVYRGNAEWLRTAVAIGTGDTPTPVGRYYIIELLRPPNPNSLYGPFAFGLSGFSETLTSFAGGEGVIGIHGTDDPSSIGTNVSHGCVRVPNDVIEAMAGVIPLGTPVVIV